MFFGFNFIFFSIICKIKFLGEHFDGVIMKKINVDKYTYNIRWSEEANAHVSTCLEFPLLNAKGDSPEIALSEIKKLIVETIEWIIDKNQQLPEPLYTRKYNKEAKEVSDLEARDFLTGLYNRNYCKRVFKEYAESGEVFSFIYFDIDEFRTINDALNHEIGDEILQVITSSLLNAIGDDAYLFRLGGDEFGCIVSEKISDITVAECIDRVISVFKETIYLETVTIDITISMGVVYYPLNITDIDDVFKVAEIAMQEAKKDQENSVCFFEKELKNRLEAKVKMESNLSSSVRNNEIFIMYQPIIELENDNRISFEALARWNSKVLGMVSPAEFIPVAEEIGQIYNIGFWVMDKAMEKLASLEKKSDKKITMSINISPLQIKEHNFIETVKQLIEKHKVSPDSIIFEFTESVFIEDTKLTKAIIEGIRVIGIHIAIDDFGTGYSSLTYLKNMDINYLKIDKTFIDDLGKSDRANALVESIINIGHKLGMYITAEGIESEEQLNILKELNCDSIQGYYYSRPLPEDELDKYL